MSKIRKYKVSATVPTGETTASAYTSPVRGRILAVGVDYDTNTCTVDLDTDGEAAAQKILNLAASNTDVIIYPRVALEDNTGTALDLSDTEGGDTAMYGHFVVYGRLKLSLASATAGDTVSVHIIVEED